MRGRLIQRLGVAAVAAWAVVRLFAPNLPGRNPAAADLSPEAWDRREPRRGRAARSPVEIPRRGWNDIFWRVVTNFNADRLSFVAGGVTFPTLFAVFPAIAAFVSLYGLFFDPLKARDDITLLALLLPPGVTAFVVEQMDRIARQHPSTLSAAFAGSVLLSVWSANASVKALIYGLNVAYHERERRSFLHYSGVTLAFTAGGLAFVLFSSALVVAAPVVAAWFGWSWKGLNLGWVRWPVLFVGYVVMLSVLYRYGPCRQKPRWRWLTPGALIAAALNLMVSALFSWVLAIAHYDVTYGPLGAAMGFMIWTWWSIIVILLGAELNAETERQTARDTTTGAPEPLGRRGAQVADTVGPQRTAPGYVRRLWDRLAGLFRKAAGPPPRTRG